MTPDSAVSTADFDTRGDGLPRGAKHFVTGSRFECSQPIKERIRSKSAANRCALFTARTIVVKELGQASAAPVNAPSDSTARTTNEARTALERLFKK